MRKRGFFLSRLAFEKLLHYFCASYMSIPAFRIFEEMVACHLVPCLYRWNWLLYILCEENKLHEAYRVCDVMFERGFLPGFLSSVLLPIDSFSFFSQGHALRGLGSESDVSHDKMVIIGRLSTSTKMEFYMQDSSKRVRSWGYYPLVWQLDRLKSGNNLGMPERVLSNGKGPDEYTEGGFAVRELELAHYFQCKICLCSCCATNEIDYSSNDFILVCNSFSMKPMLYVICYSSPSEVSWHPLMSAAANTKCGCLPWCELEKGLALGGFLCNMPFQFLISILSGELLTENSIL
ncbi:hypothetical protein POTOM_033745 [Populus tomentosa]|uniref:Pentatricopeptide repeat-containing protein n=1 Tax=Populus tomentosa TaxID=118781 RepID=A0A8X8CR54_POPTO|nr:hypothetical protein POTOM_033745 [Populus tomentosa]